MGTFLAAFVFVSGLLLASAIPVIAVAAKLGRRATIYRFVLAALTIGVFFGIASVVSERLIDDCSRSGSIACLDVGYQGLLLLVAVGFVFVAISRAITLWRA